MTAQAVDLVEETAYPEGSEENPFPHRDSAALSTIFSTLFLDVRFNLRSRRIEWQLQGMLDSEEWRAVNALVLANWRERINLQFWVGTRKTSKPIHWGRDAFNDTLNALLFRRQVDPLVEWLRGLPEWDGKERLDFYLMMMFDAPVDLLSAWAGQYLPLGVIQRTFEPGCKLDEIPVLIGLQTPAAFDRESYDI